MSHNNTGERNIKSLKTKCDNATSGCQWIGELGSLMEHLATCDHALIPCPNGCVSTKDIFGHAILHVPGKDMQKHLNEDCPRREYICPHCKEGGEYQEMITTHLEECDYVEVLCPNEGCGEYVLRCLLSDHCFISCDFQKVRCKYQDIGCEEVFLRKDQEKHENDMQHHFQVTTEAVHKLVSTVEHLKDIIMAKTNEISELNAKISELADGVSKRKLVFKVTGFAKHKSQKESIVSPPIYSGQGGYKMCFKVYANGNESGKISYVSVYAYLVRGENDDHLPWPFTGKAVIELLNQLEDRNHWTKTVQFIKNHDSSQRVVDSDNDTAVSGYGHPKYITHSSLGYSPARNSQYLKDDCLYFRFDIKCVSAPKPWLA